jgi:hypothetical protein
MILKNYYELTKLTIDPFFQITASFLAGFNLYQWYH